MNQKANLDHFLATSTTLLDNVNVPHRGHDVSRGHLRRLLLGRGSIARLRSRAGYSQATRWYTAVNAATLSSPNAITSTFCMSPDCVYQTQATASMLANYTMSNTNNVVENLCLTATNLAAYCTSNFPTPTVGNCEV
ncbi:Aste57867_2172 [Aphanomyces stellatus]|uniref:Aste57867_2172 protein n=1 Tax=Aphanomyces stellatus TaxID=120398 RepID=A0A485K810_9STRA|nr:hypothetical protein As57867_002167 [Aphanomyces stellatus]VFT79375.1 Aste57867_2172 [Aphanomyces stellatus]